MSGDDGQSEPVPLDAPESRPRYDVFIASADTDQLAAKGIGKALRRIGRRPTQLAALRVHTATAGSKENGGALDQSRFLIAVLSPAAASSDRVNAQIAHWLLRDQLDRLLLVLAAGQLSFDTERGRFDPSTSDAAPHALTQPGCLPSEPFYTDISADAPWDPDATAFRDKATALAAPIHGKPKDALAGDDVREQRLFRRLRAAASVGMAVLLVASALAGTEAWLRYRDAVAARDRATAQRLDVEAHGLLTGTRQGGDIRAFQKLLEAHNITGDDGPLLYAAAERATTTKIVRTGSQVNRVAVSPDGRHIASGQDDGSVRLWDADTGAPTAEFRPNGQGGISAVAFSPDSRRVAAEGSDNVIRFWDANSGKQIGPEMKGHTGQVDTLAFSRVGDLLASGGRDGTIRLWDTGTGRQIAVLLEGGDAIASVAFSFDGRRLASGGFDHILRLFDVDTGRQIGDGRAVHENTISSVAFSPDGRRVVTGSGDSTVRLWNADDGQPIGDPLRGRSGFTGVAFSPDGRVIAAVGLDRLVHLLDPDDLTELTGPLSGHIDVLTGAAFGPDGDRLVTGSFDQTVRTWDLTPLLLGHTAPLMSIAFSRDGRRLVSGARDGTMRLWDPRTGREIGTPLFQSDTPVVAVAISPDGATVAGGDGNGILRLIRLDSGTTVTIPVDRDSVRAVKFSPDGRTVATGGKDGLALWDAADGHSLGPPMNSTAANKVVEALDFEPSGSYIAASGDDKIFIWDVHSRQIVGDTMGIDNPGSIVSAVAYSPDGHRIAAASSDTTVGLWNVDTRQPIGDPLRGHTDWVRGVAFSPDGNLLVSGSFDGTVRMWDGNTGRPLSDPFTGHLRGVAAVAFDPDGTHVVSGGDDGAIRMWPAKATSATLCGKLTADISRSDWNDTIADDIGYTPLCRGLPPVGVKVSS